MPPTAAARAPRIDAHVHLVGVGTGGSGCWISPRVLRRPVIRLLRLWRRVTPRQLRESFDQDWAAAIARQVRESTLDHAVVLGFDGVYGAAGRLDEARSQLIVPPAWVFEVCRRHPELLPAPSLHPLRRDALERLDECIERGAVLLKWLPSAQAIDPAHPGLRGFYRRLANARLPLLVHAGGGEQTFAEVAPELKDLRLLRAPLEAGVPVVCAHTATRVVFRREPDQLPLLREMLRRYPHLWVDNSGLANPSRFPHLPRLAQDPLFTERTLYGSDYPVPSVPLFYPRRLGSSRMRGLLGMRNYFDRDVALKRALGYPDATLERAAQVLPNLARWRTAARTEGEDG